MSRETKLRRPECQLQRLHVYTSKRKHGVSAVETKAAEQIEYQH